MVENPYYGENGSSQKPMTVKVAENPYYDEDEQIGQQNTVVKIENPYYGEAGLTKSENVVAINNPYYAWYRSKKYMDFLMECNHEIFQKTISKKSCFMAMNCQNILYYISCATHFWLIVVSMAYLN